MGRIQASDSDLTRRENPALNQINPAKGLEPVLLPVSSVGILLYKLDGTFAG
jgi:hypothetical protein